MRNASSRCSPPGGLHAREIVIAEVVARPRAAEIVRDVRADETIVANHAYRRRERESADGLVEQVKRFVDDVIRGDDFETFRRAR